jgi:hypothetical protein
VQKIFRQQQEVHRERLQISYSYFPPNKPSNHF